MLGQDTLRRGVEQSVFKPVLPAGTELASASIVIAPQKKNVQLKVGNGARTMLPVRNFNTKVSELKENVTQITPLICQYVLVKGTFQLRCYVLSFSTVTGGKYIFVDDNHCDELSVTNIYLRMRTCNLLNKTLFMHIQLRK